MGSSESAINQMEMQVTESPRDSSTTIEIGKDRNSPIVLENVPSVKTNIPEDISQRMDSKGDDKNTQEKGKPNSLQNYMDSIRREMGSASLKNDIDKLSDRARKRLERRMKRNGNIMREIPEKNSNMYRLFGNNDNTLSYVYTDAFGFVPLNRIPTDSLYEECEGLTGKELETRWIFNFMNYITKELQMFFFKLMLVMPVLNEKEFMQIFKNMNDIYKNNVLAMIASFSSSDNKWWMEKEYAIFAPVLPMIYEYDYIDTMEELIIKSDFRDFGLTKLCVDDILKSLVYFNEEYNSVENIKNKSIKIPVGLVKTKEITGNKLYISSQTLGILSYNESIEYSRIIPFIGIHKDFLDGTRDGIDKSIQEKTGLSEDRLKNDNLNKGVDPNILRQKLSKIKETMNT